MKENKITFDKIKAQWDILKMSSAYIKAEQHIIQEQANGNDITGASTLMQFDPMTPEEFHKTVTDGFGNIRNVTPKELIKIKWMRLKNKGVSY